MLDLPNLEKDTLELGFEVMRDFGDGGGASGRQEASRECVCVAWGRNSHGQVGSAGGAGTGLGLYVSYNMAMKQGGDLTAANRPDGGAEFTTMV